MNRRTFLSTVGAGLAGATALSMLPPMPVEMMTVRLLPGSSMMPLLRRCEIWAEVLRDNPTWILEVLTEGLDYAIFDYLKLQPDIAHRVKGYDERVD